jgi:hypothetical protein
VGTTGGGWFGVWRVRGNWYWTGKLWWPGRNIPFRVWIWRLTSANGLRITN